MTGNSLFDKIVAAINTLGLLFALGVGVYTTFISKRKIPQEEEELMKFHQQVKETNEVESFKIDRMIINLKSRKTRLRFLEVHAYIVPFKANYLEGLKKQTAFIYDTFIQVASDMEPNELDTIAGKILLEGRIKKIINDKFGAPIIKKIFFTKFVVQ